MLERTFGSSLSHQCCLEARVGLPHGSITSNDFLHKLVTGCIVLGSAPKVDLAEDVIPVDYVTVYFKMYGGVS